MAQRVSPSTSTTAGKSTPAGSVALSEHALRISYFMLVRLVMLAGLTVLAGLVMYTRGHEFSSLHATMVWSEVASGFALTIVFARQLPQVRDLSRFAALQTATDLGLAALTVHLTGGTDSGFVTLYLIAVLGAAVMGGPRATWAAALVASVLCAGAALLESAGVLTPMTLGPAVPVTPRETLLSVARTLGGIAGVSVLSSYLNRQLSSSKSALDNLRLLNENIVRSLSSGLLTVDMDGKLLYFNPMARTILQLRDEDIGAAIDVLVPGCTLDASGGVEGRQELVVPGRSGSPVRVGLSHAPLTDDEGQRLGHVVNFQDLTRLHELSQRVRRNERLAAVGGLAASVAHEIRNPLAAISGSAELLGTAELAEEDAKLLGIIHRESSRLSDLITDLLSFTRPRPPQRRRTDLRRPVAEAAEAFRTSPEAHGVTLRVVDPLVEPDGHTIDADAPDATEDTVVLVDPAQVSQVLWNLLRNAAQALQGSGNIEIEVVALATHVRIVVKDDGPGIPVDALEKLFDPFFTTKDAGSGFGLAIVHRIVDDNGGTISAHNHSDSTGGAQFIVDFPRIDQIPQPEDSGVLEL